MENQIQLVPISKAPQFADQPLAWSLKLWGSGKDEFSEQDWHNFYDNTKKSDYQNWDLTGTNQELLFLAMVNVAGKEEVVASIGLCDFDDFEELRKYKPWIVAFVVREDLRGSGVGTQVLQLIERKALDYGISLVYLWTEGERQFYENRGYIYVETLIKPGRKIEVLKKELMLQKSLK
jgi:GNAT superfamily N-acetyltransferase